MLKKAKLRGKAIGLGLIRPNLPSIKGVFTPHFRDKTKKHLNTILYLETYDRQRGIFKQAKEDF